MERLADPETNINSGGQSKVKKLVIASGNAGKVREFKEILKDWEITSMKEEGVFAEVDETGVTFEENAEIKARALANRLKAAGIDAIAIADDSGMEVDAFDGGPGVYSARYLGEQTPYEEKNRIILEKLKDVPEEKRGARYVCAIVAVWPDGKARATQASCDGRIAEESRGAGGFGYDPIFYVSELAKNMAELTPDEKNQISHRGKALEKMMKILEEESMNEKKNFGE